MIKAIADAGTKVIICGQAVGELALHFIEKYAPPGPPPPFAPPTRDPPPPPPLADPAAHFLPTANSVGTV